MPTKVTMPQLGESVVEGTVSVWLKQAGDTVEEFEPLVEIETDKVTSEIPAPASGTVLKILVGEGETVETGTVLCIIGQAGESVGDAVQAERHPNGSKEESHPKRMNDKSTHLTPVVARMVAEHHLDVSQISGTGRDGRVTKKDVEAYMAGTATAVAVAPWEQPGSGDLFKPTPEPTLPKAEPAPKAPPRAIPTEPIPESVPGEMLKLSAMRRSIAEHMVRSKLHTAPHVTTIFEADMTNVLAHLNANKPEYAKRGVNLTLTAYFVQAMVAACQAMPIINSQWTDEGVYLHNAVHVGMAVAIDDGLIVPVIKNAEDLNLIGTACKVNELAQRARNNQLVPDDVAGGTITITNHGVSGSIVATPIINQPQTAIFGVGMMEKRVKVINDAIAIRPCCYVSLTFDHRVADGAAADGWMVALKKTLESWPAD